MSEYLSIGDLPLGEHRARVDYIECRDATTSALYLQNHPKPIFLNQKTFLSLARAFDEGNSGKWWGREVVLSTDQSEVSVKALVKTALAAASAPTSFDKIRTCNLICSMRSMRCGGLAATRAGRGCAGIIHEM
jgi:hypothetical protein